MIFDAFDKGGGGALASWLLLSGNEEALSPIIEEICKAVRRFDDFQRVREVTLALVLLGMGDAQLGGMLTESLEIPRSTSRDGAEWMLQRAIEHHRMTEAQWRSGAAPAA